MSPVFRHGGLRLYLLKLLDEAPRHGYDVIRLLQDKFLGVYSPSPGTIYPRLARLEAEGLVTHETVDGKKVYRITEAGRAELHRRLDDLADLEDELAASVRDIANEISRDVRETVRNLRDELTWAVREAGRAGRPAETDAEATPEAEAGAGAGAAQPEGSEPEPGEPEAGDAGGTEEVAADAGDRRDRQSRGDRGDWRDFTEWAERGEWREFADWARRQGWADWASKQEWQAWKERTKSGRSEWAQATRPDFDWLKGGPRNRREAGPDLMADLESLAAAFSKEIRGAARQAEHVSDDAVSTLGRILSDTLSLIRNEVFRAGDPSRTKPASPPPPAPAGEPATDQAPADDGTSAEAAAGKAESPHDTP